MFDFVREHNRIFQFILLILIVPSFGFGVLQGYERYNDATHVAVAKVDGAPITQGEWDSAHQKQTERVRRQAPNVDPKVFDTPEARRETLEGLLRERVLNTAVAKLNLTTTDARLQRLFVSDPQFAFLRKPDGSVNKDVLTAQGMTSEQFAAQLRNDYDLRQVLGGVGATVLATPSTAAAALDALLQRREVQVQRFDAKDYVAKVNPSDAELQAYYQAPAHQAQFKAAEQATVEFTVLDLDSIKKGLTVKDEELQSYYKENAKRYADPEERKASHILIKAGKEASAADRSKAKARAEALLAELRKAPAGFAEAAKKNSDDTGSAVKGGDLDYFGRGAMVPPFEKAAFSMKVGDISDVVESDFGYHIIQLNGIRGGETKPFEAVKAQVEDEVKRQLAQKEFTKAAEDFTNLVFERADSLQPAYDKFKLEKRTAIIGRTPAPGVTGPLASAKFVEALFSDDAIKNKRNTAAVEVAPNQLASGRVTQYSPAHVMPFAEVKDKVRERVVAEQAAEAARKDGNARLAALKAGGDLAGLAAPVVVSRPLPQGLSREVLDAALSADPTKLPVVVGVPLGDQGYAVVRVSQVLPRDKAKEDVKRGEMQYAQTWAAAEAQAYMEALKRRFKAEIKVKAVASAASDAVGTTP